MDDTNQISKEAIELAEKWQARANELRTRQERARQRKFARLFENSTDKIILTKLIDQCFRCADNRRTADQIHFLLAEYGIPGFFSSLEKTLMEGFIYAGRYLPGITVPAVIEKMRQDSSHLIIPGEADALNAFLQKRKDQGLRVNINYIGEEVLGEQEALSRLNTNLLPCRLSPGTQRSPPAPLKHGISACWHSVCFPVDSARDPLLKQPGTGTQAQ